VRVSGADSSGHGIRKDSESPAPPDLHPTRVILDEEGEKRLGIGALITAGAAMFPGCCFE
jgi:hypothetical protein